MTNAQASTGLNAQTWLDNAYPLEKREEVKKIGNESNKENLLDVALNFLVKGKFTAKSLEIPNDLTGSFTNFHGFNHLTELFLGNKKIDLNSVASFPITLEKLELANNSFDSSTLAPFSHLISLNYLDIGSLGFPREEVNQWYGSLEPLKNLTKLSFLCLASSDVETGLEHLPKRKFKWISFESDFADCKCLKIERILKYLDYDLALFDLNFYDEEYLLNLIAIKDLKVSIIERVDRFFREDGIKAVDTVVSLFNPVVLKKMTLEVENNNYSYEIINLNKQIAEYQEFQRIALERARKSVLTIKDVQSFNIENLQNKLTELNNYVGILLGEINFRNSENDKLIIQLAQCAKTIESKKLEIKELEDWKQSSQSKLENFDAIKASLEIKRIKLFKANCELDELKEVVRALEWSLYFANSKMNFWLSINTFGRQIIGRVPFIGKAVSYSVDVLQGITLGVRTFTSSDSNAETSILVLVLFIIGLTLYAGKLLIKSYFFKFVGLFSKKFDDLNALGKSLGVEGNKENGKEVFEITLAK